MSNDLIERLGKLQDSCNKQKLGLLDTDYVFELAGRTADALKAKDKEKADIVNAYHEREMAHLKRIEQLEAKLYDSENAYRWLKSELRTNAKIIGEQRDTIEQLEAALRIFDPGMNSLDHLGERDAN